LVRGGRDRQQTQLGGGPVGSTLAHARVLESCTKQGADATRSTLCCAVLSCRVQGANTANAPKPTGAGVSLTNLPAMEVYVIPYGEHLCCCPPFFAAICHVKTAHSLSLSQHRDYTLSNCPRLHVKIANQPASLCVLVYCRSILFHRRLLHPSHGAYEGH
jgi:hypothetical protein